MSTRRDFLRSAAALTSTAFAHGVIPEVIARAARINPQAGTTFLDAEHVVILMQENRSFDHCFGSLAGVRGFRDPRAHIQPDGNPVWFQADAHGDRYAPFRLDIAGTNATWLGGLPHTWPDQIDARNGGRYDKWLIAKPKRDLPFTLGHYTREDIPFYYALADAFTVCDQAFCSSLTGTTANRLFLWTGDIRANAADFPRVLNGDTDYTKEASWGTFPERLQDAGVPWRIYQNEISMSSGFQGEEAAWLSNFTDNPIEFFTQFNVRFAKGRRDYLPRLIAQTAADITTKEQQALAANLTAEAHAKLTADITMLKARLSAAEQERDAHADATWAALSPRARALHQNAFTTNVGDPDYRALTTLAYQDGSTTREAQLPKGDVLHQFRQDVMSGALPAVSWLVAPENFSDHPSAAWYGAWYVSEVLDILTRNPDVWQKTIFVLCYDENDGYFDHVPPFVAPHPARLETGKASTGLDTTADWGNAHGREHSIGLGYRVPLVIASPWSRGGCVNSEVADHTSILRLMETWLTARGKPVREPNISDWRRAICGDLSSAFRPFNGETISLPTSLQRDATVERIHAAKFKPRPDGGKPLTPAEISVPSVAAAQERGTRPSCPLPYELHVNAELGANGLTLVMEARAKAFGKRSRGAPFNAYSYAGEMICRSYAVQAGHAVQDVWTGNGAYHIRVDGPNGFMRNFQDGASRTSAGVTIEYASGAGSHGAIEVRASNASARDLVLEIHDESYGLPPRWLTVGRGGRATIAVETAATQGWYDFTVRAGDFAYRYAGRVETGAWSITDPAMGA